MPEIVIDGQKIEAKANQTVIQAAYDNGLQIPHFCWHPELSVAGNCRMCLVEIGMPKRLPDGTFEKDLSGNLTINYFPKLQIACSTIVSEGMHVRSKTSKAVNAQEAVMEFLLINHPLDCPICDEAGQCKLQEYAFQHSKGESRFEESKNHKSKRQVWSETVLFDAERCISCSRCIRFGKEIAKQDVLTFVQRGDHVTIELFEGTKFDNPYSMNVIDICPVGALTSPDFRFRARVWDMSFNDTICPGCSRGCNIKAGVRNNEILRLEPRTNMYVNKYWMCDYGRLTQYSSVNENRLLEPTITDDKGIRKQVDWNSGLQSVANSIKSFKPNEWLLIASPYSTNEDNFVFRKFVHEIIKSETIYYLRHDDQAFADEMLRTSDKTPNSRFCDIAGFKSINPVNSKEIIDGIKSGKFKAAYIMEDNLEDYPELLAALGNCQLIIAHTSNAGQVASMAHIALPAAAYAEIEGTWINIDGRVQHFSPAVVTKENLRTMGLKMSRLDKFGAPNDRWTHHEQRNGKQSWRIFKNIAGILGLDWRLSNSQSVFAQIADTFQEFSGMTYKLLIKHQGICLGKADNPEPVLSNYESHVMKPN